MFITSKYSGYNRHGEQVAAGLFLILMEPKNDTGKYPGWRDACAECGKVKAEHETPLSADVQATRDVDAIRRVEGCRYFRPASVSYPIRAIVRHTSLRELGHFMMGFARVHGHRITLSGSYGADGLTRNVPDAVYQHGLELPADLREAWNKGEGWNSAGSEAPLMRAWALRNLDALRK